MAKQTQSQTTARANAPTRATAADGAAQRTTRKQIPQARRGSVTRPVKKTPWSLIISGALMIVAVAVVVGVVLANRNGSSQIEKPPTPLAPPALGAAAPDFSVKASDGSTLTKASIAGKPVLFVFFASWCPHCQAEAPKLKALSQANPDLQIVAIGVGNNESQKDIWGFQKQFDLPFATYDDGGKAASVYGITSYPTLVAMDKGGMIRDRDTGEVSQDRLNALVGKAKG